LKNNLSGKQWQLLGIVVKPEAMIFISSVAIPVRFVRNL
jgi:hypothetical protein